MLDGDSIGMDGRLGIRGGMSGVSAIAVNMVLRFNNSEMGAEYITQRRNISVPEIYRQHKSGFCMTVVEMTRRACEQSDRAMGIKKYKSRVDQYVLNGEQ